MMNKKDFGDPINEEVRARMRQLFDRPTEEHSKQWSALYEENFIPWDKGFPCPALEEAFELGKIPKGKTADGKNLTALVPGCGKGYDTVLLASQGYTAYGLEIAPLALTAATEYLSSNPPDPALGGSATFISGDFYAEFPRSADGFDLVYDYTFFCAMPPARRAEWGARMAALVRAGGTLVCLEFPHGKPAETGGPPWGVTEEAYAEVLEGGFELVERYRPGRTHEIGVGREMVGIWRRK